MSIFLVLLIILSALAAAAQATSASNNTATVTAPAPSPYPPTSFIISSCTRAPYPRLCSRTLARYAPMVGTSARRLLYAAVKEAEQRASESTALVTSLDRCGTPTASSPLGSSLHFHAGPIGVCAEFLNDCADQLRMSAKEMHNLGFSFRSDRRRDEENYDIRVNNVMTWVGAAVTCQTTCVDGFNEGVAPAPGAPFSTQGLTSGGMRRKDGDPVTVIVRKSVQRASHVTSNALELLYQLT